MTKCFVLFRNCFVDDFNTTITDLAEISLNEQTLIELKEKKEAEQLASNDLHDKIYEVRDKFNASRTDKMPELTLGSIKKIPKWKAGLTKSEITQEMRDERKRLEKENNEIYKLHYEKVYAYEQICDVYVCKELNLPDDFDLYGLRKTEYTWHISTKDLI